MAARAAHIAYDHSPDDLNAAKAAKEELTQQVFTKTMNIQVWRPEHERAGRHFVYTTRYVNFFIRLLLQLGDTGSLEALAKKIRKKAGDFIGHAELWDSICQRYLNLLRSKGGIQFGHSDLMFKTTPLEVFTMNADRLDEWTHQPDFESPIIELIRDTIELKKLNGNLMKATAIEDLVGDAYATLYEKILPEILAKSNEEENRVRMRLDHVLTGPEASATNTPPSDQLEKSGDMPATKTRVRSITRREIQKRAEALAVKPTNASIATNIVKSTEPKPASEPEAAPSIGLSPPPVPQERTKEDASSVPGSVHDSADDESELSEVDDFVDAPEATLDLPNEPPEVSRDSSADRLRASGNRVTEGYERSDPDEAEDEDEGHDMEEDEAGNDDDEEAEVGDTTLEPQDEGAEQRDGEDVVMDD